MALTEQQKSENKAAQGVRDRAHSARCRLFRSAMESAEVAPEVLQAREAFDILDAACNVAMTRRNQQEADLRARIAELEAQIVALRNSPELDALHVRRRVAASDWHSMKTAKVAEVEIDFTDLLGHARFSVAAWQPPQDVLDAMEEARRTASPAPKKPHLP